MRAGECGTSSRNCRRAQGAAESLRWRHAPRTAVADPEHPPGVLYVVATPIGNLEDVTLRALRVLREVDLIAAEDTRRTQVLLRHHGIAKPMVSYHDVVERRRAPDLVERMRAGASVALVSDAGTPVIADPGYHLVRAAAAAGIRVVPIPGASAVSALVSVAGLPVHRFAFEGFPPKSVAARATRLRELATEPRALVFLEAGRRLPGFLAAAALAFGDREAVIGRELTKMHEELLRGRLPDLRARVADAPVRGEVSIVIAGASEAAGPAPSADLDAAVRDALAAGRTVRELSEELSARFGCPRRQVYRRALAIREEEDASGK
jgi:16S rRNA (cytidine1402-2'-O)-methyltransferase